MNYEMSKSLGKKAACAAQVHSKTVKSQTERVCWQYSTKCKEKEAEAKKEEKKKKHEIFYFKLSRRSVTCGRCQGHRGVIE